MSAVTNYNLIVSTGYAKIDLQAAWDKAGDLLSKIGMLNLRSDISAPMINDYQSFAIFSSGSKDGWPQDIQFRSVLYEFIEYLHDNMFYSDGSPILHWVLVVTGELVTSSYDHTWTKMEDLSFLKEE